MLKCEKEIKEKYATPGKKVVVYRGAKPPIDVLFVGEAPGWQEDTVGKPFVGPSGKLLDHWISTMPRMVKSGITNVVMVMPTTQDGSIRKPTPAEIEEFRQAFRLVFMETQPRIIILLGSTATEALLSMRVGQCVGRVSPRLYGAVFGVMYHPAYYLRQGKDGVDDFRKLFKAIVKEMYDLKIELI